MKKLLLIPILLLAIVSCSKQPKCNDDEVQKLVVETLIDEISKNVELMLRNDENITSNENYKSFQPIFKNRDKYLKEIESKLYDIRTTDLKKEIKKCDCEAEYSLVDKSNKDLVEIDIEWTGGDFNIVGFNPTIKYTAQITDENKIYITIVNPEDFEIIERNIFAKVLKDIRDKNAEITSKPATSSNVKNATSTNSNLDEELINDLQNLTYSDIAKKWINTYDRLPEMYKNNVVTNNGPFKMDYGDLYGLNKGFSWGLCNDYDPNNSLGDFITTEYGATGGKSKQDEINGYRAGMVYFYVKSKILSCTD